MLCAPGILPVVIRSQRAGDGDAAGNPRARERTPRSRVLWRRLRVRRRLRETARACQLGTAVPLSGRARRGADVCTSMVRGRPGSHPP